MVASVRGKTLRTPRISGRWASSSAAASSSRYSGYEMPTKRQPSKYGWRYHLDNTFQFILWASFGSAAIHLLNIKQKYEEKDRRLSTKIAVLKDIIRRVGEGEEVDVVRELRVGKTEEEREWEEVMNSFRQEAGIDIGTEARHSEVTAETGDKVNSRIQSAPPDRNLTPLIARSEMSKPSEKHQSSGWFWKTS